MSPRPDASQTEGSWVIARHFGANLRKARKRRDLSQEDVGTLASLHRTEIGLLERGGRTPRIDTLIKVASALDVAPAELLPNITFEPGTVTPGGFEVSPAPDDSDKLCE
jgi:transcriptional regulator with XRE-family HTH domain